MQSQAGTLLVDGGLLSEFQLKQALTTSVQVGGSLVQNTIRLGFLSSQQVANFFANRLQIPLVDGSQFDNLPAFITRLVPQDLVMEHRAIPIMLHQGMLHLAMSDPTDRAALEEISFSTGYSATPAAALDEEVEQAMARYYDIPPDENLSQPPAPEPMAQYSLPKASPVADSPVFAAGPPTLPPPLDEKDQASPVQRPTLEIYQPPSPDEDGELEEFFRSARKGMEAEFLERAQREPSDEPTLSSPSSLGAALAGLDQPESDDAAPTPTPVEEASSEDPAEDSFPVLHDLEKARELILAATERDEVARTLVRFCRTLMPRCLIFVIKRDILVGWMGAGESVDQKQVKGIMIPLSSPSVFRTVRETGTDYFGSLPHTTVNDIFLSALGDIQTRQALLIPVSVRHKPICIIYGDAGTQDGFTKDLSPVHLLVQDAAASFERIIISKKMGRVVTR